jgi:predicted enzyme related to lactoylglutathione lyase
MKRFLSMLLLAVAWHGAAASGATRLPPIVDPPTNTVIPGKFVWFDLVTADPGAARAFYGDVFGWTFQSASESGDYTVFASGDRLIGGVFRPEASTSGTIGTRWISFVSVADMDGTLAALKQQGFVVLHPATPVPGRGLQAIVRDPQGAVIGLMHSDSGDPSDEPVGPGEFFWVDLYTHDTAAAAAVYARLGYRVFPAGETEGDRVLLEAGGHARAGITPLPPNEGPPGWLPYVQVESVAATVAAATAAGGKILLPPDEAVLDGNLAVIGDPLGGVIGIIHWTSPDATEAQP